MRLRITHIAGYRLKIDLDDRLTLSLRLNELFGFVDREGSLLKAKRRAARDRSLLISFFGYSITWRAGAQGRLIRRKTHHPGEC